MSEHSIEELERQYQAARSRASDANEAERAAKRRLVEAKLLATGLLGHVVSYERGTETRKFVVQGFSRWGGERILRGFKIKKDGYLSQIEDDAEISRLTDLGPYVEPSK